MPLYTPTRHTIQAWQWRGRLADLPLDVARHVWTRGWQPPLVLIADDSRVQMPEGSWLVLGVDGRLEVLPDGTFQHRYEPVAEVARPIEAAPAPAKRKAS